MWFEAQLVLHVVDLHTHFRSAIFLEGISIAPVWKAFLICSASMYPSCPETFRMDQDGIPETKAWQHLCANAGIEVQMSVIESHNALGTSER